MATTTEDGRALHGKAGKGRWAAYGLGEVVHWTSVAKQAAGNVAEIRITGRRSSMKAFDVDGPFPAGGPTGTSVRVEQLNEAAIKALERDDVVGQLTTTFALILEQCPLVIRWRGDFPLVLAKTQRFARHDHGRGAPGRGRGEPIDHAG